MQSIGYFMRDYLTFVIIEGSLTFCEFSACIDTLRSFFVPMIFWLKSFNQLRRFWTKHFVDVFDCDQRVSSTTSCVRLLQSDLLTEEPISDATILATLQLDENISFPIFGVGLYIASTATSKALAYQFFFILGVNFIINNSW